MNAPGETSVKRVVRDSRRSQDEIIKYWNESDLPAVSIICLAYNHADFIENALNGFLIQETNFSFEIIIHDDASTDGTTDIIEQYKARYPKLIRHILQSENQYSKGKRMIALATPYARGRYIALCDGDDYWTDPLKLQKQFDFLESNSDYVITYHDSKPFNESGEVEADFGGALRDLSSYELQKATPIYTLTSFYRNLIKEFPSEFYTARFGDLFRLSLLGFYGKGKYIDSITPAQYRVHDKGVFSKRTYLQKLEMKLLTDAALLAYYRRIGNQDLATYFSEQLLVSAIATSPYLYLVKVFVGDSLERVKRLLRGLVKK